MQLPSRIMELDEFEEDKRRVKRTDPSAMKILKEWIADHDGVQPSGARVDRDFVVVEPKYESR